MQRTAIGDVHLLQPAADPEQRHAARHANPHQFQRQFVARNVVGLVARMRLDAEKARMHVGLTTGQHDAVNHFKQRVDIGDFGRTGKHQRQGTEHFPDRPQVTFAHALRGETLFDHLRAADNADHGPRHCPALTFANP